VLRVPQSAPQKVCTGSLRGRRQQLHARIAATLEDQFPEIAVAQPALLAQHCAEAGLAEKAVAYWLKAGQQAMARSATTEAVARLQKGLDVLARLPDGPWHRQQELDLQIALRPVLASTKGFSARDVGQTIVRARTLAERIDRPEYLVPLLYGQWAYHQTRAEYKLALSIAQQLERIGEMRNDVRAQLWGRLAAGMIRFLLGEFVAARALLEQCHRLGDPAYRGAVGGRAAPYAVMLGELAATLAHLGYIDRARSRLNEALLEARRLGHAQTLAVVLVNANRIAVLASSPEMQRRAEDLMGLVVEHGFPLYFGYATAFRGASLTALGEAQEGLRLISEGLAAVRATEAVSGTPNMLMRLAEAYAKLGRPAEGLSCVAEAAQIIETTDERVSEAWLHRLRGDLLNDIGDRDAAQESYQNALAVAARQSAKLFQLLAAIDLARLWRDQGKRTEARDLLAPIYDWFTEGFDTPALQEAKALLEQLA
jgi:tetratricopeptide (TPR) repeat protein